MGCTADLAICCVGQERNYSDRTLLKSTDGGTVHAVPDKKGTKEVEPRSGVQREAWSTRIPTCAGDDFNLQLSTTTPTVVNFNVP